MDPCEKNLEYFGNSIEIWLDQADTYTHAHSVNAQKFGGKTQATNPVDPNVILLKEESILLVYGRTTWHVPKLEDKICFVAKRSHQTSMKILWKIVQKLRKLVCFQRWDKVEQTGTNTHTFKQTSRA